MSGCPPGWTARRWPAAWSTWPAGSTWPAPCAPPQKGSLPSSSELAALPARSPRTLGGDMPFPTKLLNEGEEVVLDLRPHWWYLSGPIALVVVALIATIASRVAGLADVLSLVLVAALFVSLVMLLARYAKWA